MQWRLYFSKVRKNSNESYQLTDSELEGMIDSIVEKLQDEMKYLKGNLNLSDQAIKIGGFCTMSKDAK